MGKRSYEILIPCHGHMSKPPQSVTRDDGRNIFNASMLKHNFITGVGEPIDAHDSSQASLVKYFRTLNMAFDGGPCFTSVEQYC